MLSETEGKPGTTTAFTTQPCSFPSSLEVASLLLPADVLYFMELNIRVRMLDRETVTTRYKCIHFFLFLVKNTSSYSYNKLH